MTTAHQPLSRKGRPGPDREDKGEVEVGETEVEAEAEAKAMLEAKGVARLKSKQQMLHLMNPHNLSLPHQWRRPEKAPLTGAGGVEEQVRVREAEEVNLKGSLGPLEAERLVVT